MKRMEARADAAPQSAARAAPAPGHVVHRIPDAAIPLRELGKARTLSMRTQANARREISVWTVGGVLALAALLAVELAIIRRGAIGPSLDESIYMTAGRRTLEGHGITDGYLSWFAGSLLWPVVAGWTDRLAGLAGARGAAALFVLIGMAGTWRAAVTLYGRRAGFFTAVAAAVTGPVIALGHLAVIDAPAVAGLGVALWAVTHFALHDDRRWLVVAAIALAVACLAKYPAGVFAIPLALLIVVLRGSRARTDLAVFGLLAGAVVLTYFMSQRGQIGTFLGWRAENDPSFGVTVPMIGTLQLWYSGPALVLAAGGWLVSRRKGLATVLLGAGLMFPAYHLAVGSNVGGSKHAVFGLIFLLPLVGRLLSRVSRAPAGWLLTIALLAALGAHAAHQVRWLDRNFADLRPAAEYLSGHARPGDDFLIDNGWPFTWRLYADGAIDSPWRVFDAYRVEHHQHRKSLCRFDWFVAAQGGAPWSRGVERAIRRCGTYRRVFLERTEVSDFGSELRFVTWRGGVQVFRNVGRARRAGAGEACASGSCSSRCWPRSRCWVPFVVTHVNGGALWLAVPFLAANVILACGLLVGLVNNWRRSTARSADRAAG